MKMGLGIRFARILLVGLVAGLALHPMAGHGQSTWQGNGADASWSTADNWSPGLADGFSTGLVFQGSSRLVNTNDLTGGTATSITFNAGAGGFTIGGNAIGLTGNIVNNSSNLQSIATDLTLAADSTVSGAEVTLSGRLTNSGGNRRLTNSLGTGKLLTLGGIDLSEGDTGRTFQLAGTGNTTITGGIFDGGSGAGNLSVGGTSVNVYSGTVTFSGSSSYSGTTTFANNTLAVAIGGDQAFGTSTVNFNNNRPGTSGGGAFATTDVTLSNRVNIGTTFAFGGTSSIELAGPTYMTAGQNLSSAITGAGKRLTISGTFYLQDSGVAGRKVTLGSTIDITGDMRDSADGQGSTEIVLGGAGTLSFSGSNTYSGGTTISSNQVYTIVVGNKAALGTGPVTYTTGSLTISASADLSGSDAIGNAVTMNAGNALTIGGSNNIGLAGNLAGTGRLTITNTGVTTLSGGNSYAGATAVNGGTLVFAGTQAKAGGTVTAAAAGSIGLGVGGANSYTSADVAALFGNTLSGFSMNAASGVAVDTTGGNFTVSDALAGNRAFTKLGPNTLTLSGSNTFGGAFTVREGAISVATVNDASTAGPLGNSANAVVLGSSGKTGTLSYTGATAASTKPFTAASGGTAAFSVTEVATVLTLSGLIDGAGDKSFGGAGSYVIGGGFGGSGTVTKTGSGSLTLTQAGHAGGYDIQAGRLNLNAASAIGNATSLALGSGVELDNTSGAAVTINNGTAAISLGSSLDFIGTQDLSLGVGTVTLGSAAAIDVAAGTLTFAGNVVDGGNGYGITKNGAGTLVLSGLTTGAFSGNSVIDAGELYLSGTASLGGGAGTTLTLNPGGTLRIGGTASTGGVTIVDNGGTKLVETLQNSGQTFAVTTALAASDALFNGVQTIDAGVTVSASQDWLGSIPASPTAGRIVLENAAVLASTNAIDIDVNKGITLAGASATFDTSAGTIFVRPVVSGSGQLVKVGSSGFRLSNTANDYTGGTVAREGTLGIYGDGSLGAVSGALLLDGGTVNSAQGTSGQTVTIDTSRVVQLANGKTSGLAATNGSTLAYAGVLAEAAVGSAAGLRIGSATQGGTVLLGGANTYAGDTIIAGGTLKLASGGSFDTSPRIIVGDATSNGAVFDLTDKTSFSLGASQTLMGKGIVVLGSGTNLTIGGLLSPGNSPGLLTYDGGGTVTLSGTTLMEIQGTTRGTTYDAIDVLGGTELNFGDGILQLDFDQTFADGTAFSLFTPDGTSSLTGTFSSIAMVVGSAYADLIFTDNDGLWTTNTGGAGQSMTFDSSTGNLAIVAVPEPGGLALLMLPLLPLLPLIGRRRRERA